MTVDNVHTFYCFSCGTVCAIAGSDASKADPSMPIMGRYDGEPWCDICIGNKMLGGFCQGMSDIVYISQDGRSFQTWGGSKRLGRVTELGGKDGIWPWKSIEKIMQRLPVKAVHWAGVTEDGVHVYGRTMGHGMAATAHVRRRRGAIVVEAGSPITEKATP